MTVDRSTETRIRSGSSDCEAKALTVMPCIRPAALVVMIVTPLAKWPITWRKDALSSWFTPIRYTRDSRDPNEPLHAGIPRPSQTVTRGNPATLTNRYLEPSPAPPRLRYTLRYPPTPLRL